MSENVAGLFQEAIAKDKAGEPEEARRLLDTLLQYQGDNRLGLFYRGSVKIRANDVAGAIKDWELAFEGADSKAASRVQEQFGDLVETCLSHFAFETTVDPNDPIAHSAYGRACVIFGRVDQAQRHLQRAWELDRHHWKEGLQSSEILIRQGQTDPAQQILQKLLETHADNAEIQYTLGLFFQQTNSLAFALRHLEKAAALDPRFLPTRQLLADIYLHQGRFEQAETQYRVLIAAAPSARAHLGVAACLKQQYRFEEALECYRQAVELEPEHFRALCDLGALALQFGDMELGMKSLKKALEIEPNHAEIYSHLAKAAQQKGDVGEAVSAYRKLLELDANDANASYTLANLLRSQGDFEEASELLKKALERRAGDVQVSLELSHCLVELDRADEALTLLRSCFAEHPNHKELRFALSKLDSNVSAEDAPAAIQSIEECMTLAQLHLKSGRTEDAAQAYRAALAIKADEPECLLQLGRIYAQRGLLEPGVDLMLQSFALTPTQLDLIVELMGLLARMDDFERGDSMAQLAQILAKNSDNLDWLNFLWAKVNVQAVADLLTGLMDAVLATLPPQHALAVEWNQRMAAYRTEEVAEVAAPPVLEEVHAPAPVVAPPPAPPAPAAPVAALKPLPPLADALNSFTIVCYVQPHKIDKRTTFVVDEPAPPPPWQAGAPLAVSAGQIQQWAALPPTPTPPPTSPAPFFRELARSLAQTGWLQEAVTALASGLIHEPTMGAEWLQQLLGQWCLSLESSGRLEEARVVCRDWNLLFPGRAQAQEAHQRLGDVPVPVVAPVAAEEFFSSDLFSAVLAEGEAAGPKSIAVESALAEGRRGESQAPAATAATFEELIGVEPMPAEIVAAEPIEPFQPGILTAAPFVAAPEPAAPVPELLPAAPVAAEVQPAAPAPEVLPAAPVAAEVQPAAPAPEVLPPAPVAAEVPPAAPVPEVLAPAPVAAEVQPAAPIAEVLAPAPVAAEVQPTAPAREFAPAAAAAPAVQPAAPVPEVPAAATLAAAAPAPQVIAAAAVAPAVQPPIVEIVAPTAPASSPTPAASVEVAVVSHFPAAPAVAAPRLLETAIPRPTTAQQYQDLLRSDPDLPEALDWAWEVAKQQESEYLNIFRDLTKTTPDEPRHVRNFARAYLRLNRPLLAVVQFQKFLNASPSSRGFRELAEVYQKLNRERNSSEALQKAADMEKQGL